MGFSTLDDYPFRSAFPFQILLPFNHIYIPGYWPNFRMRLAIVKLTILRQFYSNFSTDRKESVKSK